MVGNILMRNILSFPPVIKVIIINNDNLIYH